MNGWAEEPETSSPQGASILPGRRSRRRQNDPGVLANAAFVLAYFGEDIGAMIGLVDRALALNPSFARGWFLQRRSQDAGPANPISRSSMSRPRCA